MKRYSEASYRKEGGTYDRFRILTDVSVLSGPGMQMEISMQFCYFQ